jgi:hypothetical protein
MTQKIYYKGIGASGIVGTLVIVGIVLKMLGIYPVWATVAIVAGICIGILLGFLGVVGVFTKVFR